MSIFTPRVYTGAPGEKFTADDGNRVEGGLADVSVAAEAAQETAAAAATAAATASGSSTATGIVSLENGERPIASNGEKGETGEQPQHGVVAPDGRHVYVTNAKSKTISIYGRFGTAGLALLGTLAMGAGTEPKGIAITPSGKFVYVADWAEKKIWQFERNRFTGELKALGTASINVAANTAKVVHLCVSPDEKHVYAVAEEAKGEPNKGKLLFQYEIQAGGSEGQLKALTPEAVASETLEFCNYVAISPDGKSVYVAYSSGLRLYERNAGTGLLTMIGLQESSGAIGTVVVSPDNESVYSTCSAAGKGIDMHSRNTGTGVLTKLGVKAIEKAQGIGITSDGRSVFATSTTLNEVFGFKRAKPEATWELTPFATPSVATETKPFRTLVSPDGVNVYILNETSKTLKGYSRFVQVKVETQYVTTEGIIDLSAQGEGINGKLRPAKRVSQTSFYVICDDPLSTGKVGWSMPAEGPSSAAVEQPLTLAILSTLAKEQDRPGNVRGFSKEVMRYDMTGATPIAEPLQKKLLEALQEGSREKESDPLSAAKISKLTLLTQYAPEDFGTPIILGKATDPEYTVEDAFTKQTKVHIPAGYQQAEGDHDLTVDDVPSGRRINLGGKLTVVGSTIKCENLSCHDLINGPSYSSNEQAGEHPGGEVQMSGAALVAGSSTQETGGGSAARLEKGGYTILFRQLQDAVVNPFGVPQMMRATIRQKVAGVPGSGQAPRGTTLFENGVVVSPENAARGPYVGPLAHQGEVTGNNSTNVYALPMGAILRLNPAVWTQQFIEELSCPNWVRWIFWCLRSRGTVVLDVQGQPGVELCRVESLRSYSYRNDSYATSWLEQRAKSDGAFCVQGEQEGHPGNKTWRLDITGGGAIPHSTIFAGLQVIKPPPKPAAFPN